MNPYRYLERRKARQELTGLEFELRISQHPQVFMEHFVSPAMLDYEKRFGEDKFIKIYSTKIWEKEERESKQNL